MVNGVENAVQYWLKKMGLNIFYYHPHSGEPSRRNLSVLPPDVLGFIVQYSVNDGSWYHPKCRQKTGTMGGTQLKRGETGNFTKLVSPQNPL